MYKQGFALIGTAAFLHIITQIFQFIQDQTLDIFRNESHVFSIIIPIIIGIIGIVLIFKDKFGWFKNKDNRKQYDAKKLNETVFRKLMRVECIEDEFFFIEKFGFCIPTNKMAFTNKSESDYLFWAVGSRDARYIHKEFDIIERIIPNLETGEQYLKIEYYEIYKQWIQIKKDLEELNLKRKSFFNSISKQIGKKLKKHFNCESKLLLHPFGDECVFFEENTEKILPYQFNTHYLEFELDNPCENQYYVTYRRNKILGSNKNTADLDVVKDVFTTITNDRRIIDKKINFDMDKINLNKRISDFCDQLEHKVVHDIDAQITS